MKYKYNEMGSMVTDASKQQAYHRLAMPWPCRDGTEDHFAGWMSVCAVRDPNTKSWSVLLFGVKCSSSEVGATYDVVTFQQDASKLYTLIVLLCPYLLRICQCYVHELVEALYSKAALCFISRKFVSIVNVLCRVSVVRPIGYLQ